MRGEGFGGLERLERPQHIQRPQERLEDVQAEGPDVLRLQGASLWVDAMQRVGHERMPRGLAGQHK